jgi:hypothetical protein
MSALRRWFTPPSAEDDPREIMAWVRRNEVIAGVAIIGFAVALWDHVTWRWVLLAMGLVSLSPWPGAAAILRKAERKPGVLVWDPDRRRARERRVAIVQVPIYVLTGGVSGFLLDGWRAAILMALFMGACAGGVSWRHLRRRGAR